MVQPAEIRILGFVVRRAVMPGPRLPYRSLKELGDKAVLTVLTMLSAKGLLPQSFGAEETRTKPGSLLPFQRAQPWRRRRPSEIGV
jgi:hypothetical protein